MFASPLLDRMTRVHPAVVPALFVPVIIVFAALAADAGLRSPLAFAGWVIGGYVVWTLTEYWLHRIVFHFEPEAGIGARLHWMMHGVHHDHPNDPLRLVMPPSASVPLAAIFALAFHGLLPTAGARALSAGFFAGYLAYDMTHYYVHHFVPRSRLGKLLRENHMRHHFQDDTTGFGVSAPWWDVVFGTAPRSRGRRHPASEPPPASPSTAPAAAVPQTRS
jgi:sterol desaturase/sphingolipid hydroxylase (fatty acid hydroxylase superfamily)